MRMTPKILIVDDEELNRLTLEAFLGGDGYEIHFTSRGAETCARARALQPDLILLDVMMPDLDGFSVCRLIRADPVIGRIPIILITALDDDASRLEGLQAGADEFVTKPCRRAELRARVRTIALLNRFRSMAEQRARFQRLYELAPMAIVLTDASARVLAANPPAKGLLNVSPGDCLTDGSRPGGFGAAGAAAVQTAIDRVLGGGAPEPDEVRFDTVAMERILQLRVAAVPDGDGQIALLIFDDVTAEVRARAALREMNSALEDMVRARTRQLEEANTLLMSYASFVSHDLRSPLTAVKGYLGLVQEGIVPINAEAAPLVSQAFAAATMMDELIHNILQLAREEHAGGASSPVAALDPTPIVQRLAGHHRSLAGNPNVSFVIGPLPPVGASAVVLERVFYNLMANAVKYSAARPDPRIEIGAQDGESGPVLFVRDNGIGFDPREGDKLFWEFSRLSTAAAIDGLGLGLSFVARLVRVCGGRIWAESAPGAGATFFVQFPPPQAVAAGVRPAA
jgi:signal transduction histidine kinase